MSKETEEGNSIEVENVKTVSEANVINVEENDISKDVNKGESIGAEGENVDRETGKAANEEEKSKVQHGNELSLETDKGESTEEVTVDDTIENSDLNETETKQISINMRMKRIVEVNKRLNE